MYEHVCVNVDVKSNRPAYICRPTSRAVKTTRSQLPYLTTTTMSVKPRTMMWRRGQLARLQVECTTDVHIRLRSAYQDQLTLLPARVLLDTLQAWD
jgi:hypothetical protein